MLPILSAVAMLFLIKIGIPCNGLYNSVSSHPSYEINNYPRVVPLALSASSCAAIDIASGFTSVTTFNVELTSEILARYAWKPLVSLYAS